MDLSLAKGNARAIVRTIQRDLGPQDSLFSKTLDDREAADNVRRVFQLLPMRGNAILEPDCARASDALGGRLWLRSRLHADDITTIRVEDLKDCEERQYIQQTISIRHETVEIRRNRTFAVTWRSAATIGLHAITRLFQRSPGMTQEKAMTIVGAAIGIASQAAPVLIRDGRLTPKTTLPIPAPGGVFVAAPVAIAKKVSNGITEPFGRRFHFDANSMHIATFIPEAWLTGRKAKWASEAERIGKEFTRKNLRGKIDRETAVSWLAENGVLRGLTASSLVSIPENGAIDRAILVTSPPITRQQVPFHEGLRRATDSCDGPCPLLRFSQEGSRFSDGARARLRW